MDLQKADTIVLRISGFLFIAGGIVHWLIIFGVLVEKAPFILGLYFHSLAVLSAAAGLGLMLLKNWGIKTATFICVTQIPAHLYMMYLDSFKDWNSGYSITGRAVDLFLVVFFIWYVTYRHLFPN